MKTYSIALFLFIASISFAQSPMIDSILKLEPIPVSKYEIDSLSDQQFFLRMDYGTSTILNPDTLFNRLKGKVVERVELVYTDFSQSKKFNQPKLNKARLRGLYYLDRSMFNGLTDWKVVAQTAAKSPAEGSELFHGFVISYVTPDKSYLDKLIFDENEELPDSTVLTVFERNREWRKMLVVADLTGSMSPYTAQVMLWLKLNQTEEKSEHFTFFNDGDEKTTEEKVIGSTGGIYHSNSKKFIDILALAKETMVKGYGGDDPENDIEAILSGLARCSQCEDIVLIGDNNADMRDIELASQIKKPVKIIVCGSDGEINTEYLDLARMTKGSIHTIEEDIMDLMQLKEGEIVKIGEYQYQIKDGKFVQLDKT
ncbi:MAG: hypothetical protein ACPG19_00515 [Saprospiraceae bacterium]